MLLIDAVPKEIHVIVEIPFEELKMMKLIMDNMTFNYNSEDEYHVEAKVFLENTWYPVVAQMLEGLTNGITRNPK